MKSAGQRKIIKGISGYCCFLGWIVNHFDRGEMLSNEGRYNFAILSICFPLLTRDTVILPNFVVASCTSLRRFSFWMLKHHIVKMICCCWKLKYSASPSYNDLHSVNDAIFISQFTSFSYSYLCVLFHGPALIKYSSKISHSSPKFLKTRIFRNIY